MNKNKFAIISGASRGIGLALSEYFVKHNYDIAMIARDIDKLTHAKETLTGLNKNVSITVHDLDVSDSTKTYETIQTIIKNKGRLDVLFNNAGIAHFGTSELSLSDFEKMMSINVNGLFAAAKAAAEVMKQQKSGYIFNLASMSGKRTFPGSGGYCASKFAVVGLSEALFQEMAAYDVKVTAICPSLVDTSMTAWSDITNDKKIQLDDIVKTVDFCLNLSSHAVLSSIDVQCREFIKRVHKLQ